MRFIVFNTAFAKWCQELGIEADVTGKTISEAFPFLPEKIYAEYQQVFETGKTVVTTDSDVVGDSEIITETTISPIIRGNRVEQVLTVRRDITEHKRAGEKLRESEEKFRTVANFTYDSEYWIGPDNNLIYQSPSIERITGYTAEEHIENHPGLFFNLVHPEDRERVSKHFEKDIGSSEVTRFAFRIISRSGEVHWLENISQAVFDDKGNFLGRRGSSRDITERKRAEEETKAVLPQSELEFSLI